jgi:hypothetical protein
MKALTSLLLVTSLSLTAWGQEAPTEPKPAPKVQLTPEQIKTVLTQLAELEKSILAQRGSSLAAVIGKLRTAASSDAAAANFIEDCDVLVNVTRKDGDRDDKRRIEQRVANAKRTDSKKEEEKDGDEMTGMRLGLEYMALTLEAHEAKSLDLMVPKVQAFHQALMAQGEKLRGRAGEILNAGGGRRGSLNTVIEAYQLDDFMHREGWPTSALDVVQMYEDVILPSIRTKKPEAIGATWDSAIQVVGTISKGRMFEGEYAVWMAQELPEYRWSKAVDLVNYSTTPATGLSEMLKVVKDYPSHSKAPTWLNVLRGMVQPAEATPAPAVAP